MANSNSKADPKVERLVQAAKNLFTKNGMCGCGARTYKLRHGDPCFLGASYFEELRQALLALEPAPR